MKTVYKDINARVFLISGKAESGKDTVGKMIASILNQYNPSIYHFATEVKKKAMEMGWDGVKDEKGRAFLQWLGDGMHEFYPSHWTKVVLESIFRDIEDGRRIFIIPDWRYEIEFELIREAFPNGTHTCRVVRGNHESSLTTEQQLHRSECELDNFVFNQIFLNNRSMDDLETIVRWHLESYAHLTALGGVQYGKRF